LLQGWQLSACSDAPTLATPTFARTHVTSTALAHERIQATEQSYASCSTLIPTRQKVLISSFPVHLSLSIVR
jgi:hypothetical protein